MEVEVRLVEEICSAINSKVPQEISSITKEEVVAIFSQIIKVQETCLASQGLWLEQEPSMEVTVDPVDTVDMDRE